MTNLLSALLLGAALAAVAPGLGWPAQLLIGAMPALMIGTGRFALRLVRLGEEPFLALVVGFAVLAHALVVADLIRPGAHGWVALAMAVPAVFGLLRGPAPGRADLGLALLAAGFTWAWNHDVAARLAQFHAMGVFPFWMDGLVHAANLAQFASPEAIGRGLILMADVPRPLYHYASYMPAALLAAVTRAPVLEATMLGWLPLGVLVMAAGVAALGRSLGGERGTGVAAAALIGLALVPAPEKWTLGNGFLGFAWLLETSPGTAYSLGVGCAALAALVLWMRRGRWAELALALGLCAACFLVRFNTFVWLAPTVGLGVVAGWPGIAPRIRMALVVLGVAVLAAALAALSWDALRGDPRQFLFGYLSTVHTNQAPTRIDGLQAFLAGHAGRIGAGLLDIPLTLLGILGPWLPAFLAAAALAFRRSRPRAEDALPWLLLLIASLAMILAPVSRNGDIGEYRHRAGPLLVAVVAVWTLHYAHLLAAPWLERWRGRGWALAGASALSLAVLAATIGEARRPTMGWAMHFRNWDWPAPPALLELASMLREGGYGAPRFAVAGLPPQERNIDDAALLTALTGIPAYLSCAGYFTATGGPTGEEAVRRLGVLARLAEAPDIESLRALMRTEGITHYVVSAADLPFDPGRRLAAGRFGEHAVYTLE